MCKNYTNNLGMTLCDIEEIDANYSSKEIEINNKDQRTKKRIKTNIKQIEPLNTHKNNT